LFLRLLLGWATNGQNPSAQALFCRQTPFALNSQMNVTAWSWIITDGDKMLFKRNCLSSLTMVILILCGTPLARRSGWLVLKTRIKIA